MLSLKHCCICGAAGTLYTPNGEYQCGDKKACHIRVLVRATPKDPELQRLALQDLIASKGPHSMWRAIRALARLHRYGDGLVEWSVVEMLISEAVSKVKKRY